jgi:hypothetical protein
MEDITRRTNGGWPEKKHFYMSQALSCLQLRRFYSDVELITDTAGRRLLVEEMGLPYTTVSMDLDDFKGYPAECWPIKNFFVYSIQQDPFIHVEGDIFIPCKFDTAMADARLVLENTQCIHSDTLQSVLSSIILELEHRPDYLSPPSESTLKVYGSGIFGGNDLSFIHAYAEDALRTINSHPRLLNDTFGFGPDFFRLEEIELSDVVNILFGSQMLTGFIARDRKEVVTVFDTVEFARIDDTKKNVASWDFSDVRPIYNKKKEVICHQLEHRLRQAYPDYYYKILRLIKEFSI